MTTFDKREGAFEAQFAHDEEQRFKAEIRRDKLVGAWAAEQLGKMGAEAETYARSMVAEGLREPGTDDIFKRIRADFDAAGVDVSDHRIHRTIDEMMARAVAEIKAGL